MKPEDITPTVLLRLVVDGMNQFCACAPGYTSRTVRGAAMSLTREPSADMNMLALTRGDAPAVAAFEGFVGECDEHEVPFVAMVGPAAVEAGVPACEGLGLVYAVDWPLMVCPAERARAHPAAGVTVRRMASAPDHEGMARVLASAFNMPAALVMRAMPLELVDSPSIDIYVAADGDGVQSCVTVTRHGSVVGVWGMGTRAQAQGRGIGKALLSEVMADHRDLGATAFFLGATPAGFPLYERLGYDTVCKAQAWVRGETSQA